MNVTCEDIIKKRLIQVGVVFVIFLSTLFLCKTVAAKKTETRMKTIASVQIEKGDSLWSIASNYITDEYSSVEEYIEEIKRTNHLTTDTIHTGGYLIIPYYMNESETMYADMASTIS